MRDLVREYKTYLYFWYESKNQYKKPFISKEQVERDLYQSGELSLKKDIAERIGDIAEKNLKHYENYIDGEEGVDKTTLPKGFLHPDLPNPKVMERQTREQIKLLKITDPEKAHFYEETLFKPTEIDKIFKEDFDISQVKLYPGSEKGSHPADDPDAYSKWFSENQPVELLSKYYFNPLSFSEFGVKKKTMLVSNANTDNHEQKMMTSHFLEEEDFYPLAGYDGAPEFDLLDREKYTVQNDDDLPTISFSTNIGPNELTPLPIEHTLNYQEYHHELENWTLFRSLPIVTKYD